MTNGTKQTGLYLDSAVAPVVGGPCTYNIGGDYYPGTVQAVSKTGRKVTWSMNRTGEVRIAYRNTSGTYQCGHGAMYFGEARDHLDPHF